MSEGQQPRITQQKIEGAGEEGEAQGAHQENRIDQQRSDDTRNQQQAVTDDATVEDATVHGVYLSLPNSPIGRTSRTSAMMAKTAVLDAGE